MGATCLDQRRPSEISEPHGTWWLTARLPLTKRRHFYVGAATGYRFVPRLERWAVAIPWLCVSLPRVGCSSPSLRVHRWCAHIQVSYESAA